MHGFARRLSAVVFGATVAVNVCADIVSAQLNDSVGIAQRVLRAAYPELKGSISVGLNTDTDSDWRSAPFVSVVVRVHDNTANDHSRVVLVAHVQVALSGLSSVLFSGTYVEQDDHRAIVAYARRQNDTTERVIEELKKAGLRFLTDENAFLEAAGLHRLEPVLGKIQSAQARFVAVPPIPTPVDYEFQPGWVVELQVITDQKAIACFSVSVEPVNLRVERITRRTCSK